MIILLFIILSPTIIVAAITGAGCLIGGGALGYILFQFVLRKHRDSIISDAEAEAEVIKKEKMLQAKEKYLQLKDEHEKIVLEKNNNIARIVSSNGVKLNIE